LSEIATSVGWVGLFELRIEGFNYLRIAKEGWSIAMVHGEAILCPNHKLSGIPAVTERK